MYNRLLLLLYIGLQMVTAAEIMRKRKMLVRRKLPILNSLSSQNFTQSHRRGVRPLKVIRKKILSPASPLSSPMSSPLSSPLESDITAVLSSPLDSEVTTVPPQSRPFSVKETVPPKPDAVKRCENNNNSGTRNH